MCTLYERIIDLCRERGVSGSRMCLDLGLSKSTLSNMKSGRTAGLSTATAQKVASYFNVTIGYLLGEEERDNAARMSAHDQDNTPDLPLSSEFNDLLEQLTLQELRDVQAYMLEKIKNRR